MTSVGYHEPLQALSNDARDLHRAIVSLMEELEAVDWYNQRAEACSSESLRAILEHNRDEEKEHAIMLMEWLRRNDIGFATQLAKLMFTSEPIAHEESP